MRLLLINYEMDENSLALPHQAKITSALARRVKHLSVITQKVGFYHPEPTMSVDCIPHWPWGIPIRLGSGFLVNSQVAAIIKRDKPDAVFIHMAHNWAYRLWPVFTLNRLPVLLWYAHGAVSHTLRLATAAADAIISSTPDGFRLPSPKVSFIGQGIDTETFQLNTGSRQPVILYWGRVSPSKKIIETIKVFAEVCRLSPNINWQLNLIGGAASRQDAPYLELAKAAAQETGLTERITFLGPRNQAEIAAEAQKAALAINLSATGSMDKTTLEALSCGTPVLTTNIALQDILSNHPDMFTSDTSLENMAQRVLKIINAPPAPEALRNLIVGRHDQSAFVEKIIGHLEKLIAAK